MLRGECIEVSPYLVTSGVDPCSHKEEHGPTFHEGPVECKVDLVHDSKAYLAEQVVTREQPGEKKGNTL